MSIASEASEAAIYVEMYKLLTEIDFEDVNV